MPQSSAFRSAKPTASRWAVAAIGFGLGLGACSQVARSMMIVQMKVSALLSPKEIEIELTQAFVARYRNRVTITTELVIDEAATDPNGIRFDGDFHAAGRSPDVGLPVIIEVIAGGRQKSVTDLIHRVEGTGRAVPTTGVWRVWPEHGGGPSAESDTVDRLEDAYAHHVFEIHPATSVGGIDLLDSFEPIEGYKPGNAKRTFAIWEKTTATIRVTPTTIAVVTRNGLYNDVHFLLEIGTEPQRVVEDGRFVVGAARDLAGKLLVQRIKAVFVGGTAPERAVKGLQPGARIHVWGLPRVDYDEISRRALGGAGPLAGTLPYEIIILAVYPD